MTEPSRTIRFTVALLLCVSVFIVFAGDADASDDDTTVADFCATSGGYGEACADVTPATPATPEIPATPETDPAIEHEQAFTQANDALAPLLAAPGWQIWPNHAHHQIVNLWTFMTINGDNWTPHNTNATVGAVTVSMTAEPKKSHWKLTEAATGVVHEIACDGEGSPWSDGETLPECGWKPEHTTAVTGPVSIEVEIEFEVTWASSWAGAPAASPYTEFSRTSQIRELTVSEVQAFGFDAEGGSPAGGDQVTPGNGDNADGSVAGEQVDTGATGLPVSTLTCSVWLEGTGNALGGDVSLGGGVELIIEEFADGTQLVTIAGDAGASLGTGSSAGFYVGVGDLTVGSYAKAEAAAWGTVGGGVQYELAPGESWQGLLAELSVLGNPAVGTTSTVINAIVPFGDPVPTAPNPDAVFFDVTAWGQVGGTVQSGVGIMSIGASASAKLEANTTYKATDDGYSITSTFAGELSADASIGAGVPFFAWLEAGVGGQAQGSISVETVYDKDLNPVELVVSTSYGWDGDVILGDGLVEGQEGDALSITSQQWTFDLTDPGVSEAVAGLDDLASEDALPSGNEPYDFGLLTLQGQTTGPVTQQVTDNMLDFGVGAGVLGAGVELEGSAGCLELS